ncbi:S41 family peptidase [Candidatus Peribacteria bacterium]|nr:MAG: S41 family peptidase [Candidatus Peribacteria bacterium]
MFFSRLRVASSLFVLSLLVPAGLFTADAVNAQTPTLTAAAQSSSVRTLSPNAASRRALRQSGISSRRGVTRSQSSSSVPTISVTITKPQNILPDQDMLQAVWQLLNNQYLYNAKIDSKEAAYKAAEAMVESLKDPYTMFLRPAPAQEFKDQIGGQVTGIGAQVEYKDNVLTIVAPISGSPAEKAGLKPGDKILEADGLNITNIGFLESVSKVRGPKGTSVKLHIDRGGVEMDITVMRDTIKLPEIDVSFQGSVAVVRLSQFGETTDRELRGMLEDVSERKPTGLILDLRNNPGGLLHAADIVVSNFLPKGSTVAHIVSRSGDTPETTRDEPTIDADVPVVVLVNKGSASAAEITAGALQDAKRATVVGEQTFGKGTVQQILQFRDGSELKMTIAEWETPLRRKINGIGVKPDYIIPANDVRDDQMAKALELLR